MSSENFKYQIREKLADSKLINLFTFFNKREIPVVLFFLLFMEPVRFHLKYPDLIFETSGISLFFLAIKTVAFFFSIRILIKISKTESIDHLWKSLNNYILNFLGLFLFLTFSFIDAGIDVLIFSIPYSIYMCNIAFLFFSSQISDKSEVEWKVSNLKIVSLGIHLLSFSIYILIGETDPLYITNFVTVTPFFIIALFAKIDFFSFFAYRILFVSLFFFAASTISPYLLLLGLLIMWLGKLCYFLKYDIKYPSFYKKYDIC